MPQVGFVCPIDQSEHKYADCMSCVRPCLPLPLLLVLSRNERPYEPNIYHVTEILNPPKVVYFNRHYPYYADPLDSAYTTFGSSFHSIMESGAALVKELGLGEQLYVEEPFSVSLDTPAGTATLRGRPDIYDAKFLTLYDYKTEKAYTIKKLKEGNFNDSKHMAQLNIYRHFAYPKAEHLIVVAMIKDHGRQTEIRDGLRPIEQVEVPIMAPVAVQEYTVYRVAENLRAEKDPATMRECVEEELWLQPREQNLPLRCQKYCAAGKTGQCLQGCELLRQWKERMQHGSKRH